MHWRRDGRRRDLRGLPQLSAPHGETTSVGRDEIVAVALITAVALVVRLAALRQPIRYDEAITWTFFSARSWSTIVSWYPFPNNHVLFSLLAKATGSLAPYQPWAFRLPALVFGVAIVPLTWAVGRRLFDRRTALVGAGLTSGSMPLVLYSVNARGHTIVVAFSLVLILLSDRLRERPSWWGGWIAWSVVAALGLYAVPVMIYPIGAVSTWIGLDALCRRRGSAVRTLAALAAAGLTALLLAHLMYLPIVRSAGLGAVTGNKLAQPISFAFFVSLLPKFIYEIVSNWTLPLPWWCIPLTFGLAFYGLFSRRGTPRGRVSLALATLLWSVGLFVLSHRQPFARFWLFMLPLFLLCVARGLVRLAERLPQLARARDAWVAGSVTAAMAFIALATRAAEVSNDTGTYRHAREVAVALAKDLRAGDRVLAPIPNNAPLVYYFGELGLDPARLDTPPLETHRAYLVLNPARGQTLQWAVARGMIDPRFFAEPVLLVDLPDAQLWRTDRR